MDTTTAQKTLTKINLRNFMCYQRPTTVTFQPGLNAIVGPNDQGKSTLLAAVGWVLTGKPAGDTVESWNGDRDVKVALSFDDGLSVSRFREKGANRYEITNGKVQQDFRAIGNSVPQEVLNALNLEEINFQGQANNLFPMQLTPGEFGALVNKHCRLDEIHTTMKRVASELRQWDREITKQQAVIDDATMRLEELQWVPKAEGMIAVAEALEQRCSILAQKIGRAEIVLDRVALVAAELDEKRDITDILKKRVETACQLYNKVSTLKSRIDQFCSLITKLSQFKEDQEWSQQVLRARPLLDAAQKIRSRISEQKVRLEKTQEIIVQIQSTKETLKAKQFLMMSCQKELKKMRANLPPICPLCGQPIKKGGP